MVNSKREKTKQNPNESIHCAHELMRGLYKKKIGEEIPTLYSLSNSEAAPRDPLALSLQPFGAVNPWRSTLSVSSVLLHFSKVTVATENIVTGSNPEPGTLVVVWEGILMSHQLRQWVIGSWNGRIIILTYQPGIFKFLEKNDKIGIEKILMPNLPSKRESGKVFSGL